jgi:putative nucleotidyltransferase with HDIG domain
MNAAALIAKVPALPPPSASIIRLSQMLGSQNADTHAIIEVVRQDGVMSAKLLGRCNSAAYALRSPVNSIEHAVMVLGHQEIHNLVISAGFGSLLNPALSGYAISEGDLWSHSLITAHVAAAVCRIAKNIEIDPSVAYMAGLIHDIGKHVLSHALDQDMQTAIHELIQRQKYTFVEAEAQIVGTDHAAVGKTLLHSWGLPELLIEAVANHHSPLLTPTPQLSAVVHVADIIAHQVGASPGRDSFAVRAHGDAVTALGLCLNDIDFLIASTVDDAQKVRAMIR